MRTPSVAWLVILCLLLLLGRGRRTMAQSEDEEYRVKAAFLFHFAQLVDWPPGPPVNAGDSLSICTYGDDPFQGALESTVAGKMVGAKIIRILHVKRPELLLNCQILYLGQSQSKRIPALLATLSNAPVLTVGETPGFLNAGGMVRFLLQENRLRFSINLVAAENARLKIGSRLLVLAQNLEQESEDK